MTGPRAWFACLAVMGCAGSAGAEPATGSWARVREAMAVLERQGYAVNDVDSSAALIDALVRSLDPLGRYMGPDAADPASTSGPPPVIAEQAVWPDDLAYLRVSELRQGAGQIIASAVRGLGESGRRGLVIDLRGASGENLQSVADCAALFVRGQPLLFTVRPKNEAEAQAYKAPPSPAVTMPVMVLLNKETRGAAELLAAVMHATPRGVLTIGTETFGDPAVRECVPLPSGGQLYVVTRSIELADGSRLDGASCVAPAVPVNDSLSEPYAPEAPDAFADEEERARLQLRERTDLDPALRRAVDILLGLRALAGEDAESDDGDR